MLFQEIIDQQSLVANDLDLLPFCHTTTEGYFNNIKEKQTVDIKLCPIYKESILYFFYGKPSYKVSKEAENYTNNPPITLIYEPKNIGDLNLKRMLPFDSGGYSRYKMKEGYEKEAFTHEKPNENSIKGLIKLLYENNDSYLKDDVSLEKLSEFIKNCWPVKEIIELYVRVQKGEIDSGDQVYSIELQFDKEIKFQPKYVVIPYSFLTTSFWDETNFKQQFPNVKVEYYGEDKIMEKVGKVLTGAEYQDLMRQKVMALIK